MDWFGAGKTFHTLGNLPNCCFEYKRSLALRLKLDPCTHCRLYMKKYSHCGIVALQPAKHVVLSCQEKPGQLDSLAFYGYVKIN